MSTGAFEEFTGGLESMYGGEGLMDIPLKSVLMGLLVVYLVWFLWKNWSVLSGPSVCWNPAAGLMGGDEAAVVEGMSPGLRASLSMATMPGGTGKFLVSGDSLNNSSGWLPEDYAGLSGQAARAAAREGMWTAKREGLSNFDVHQQREGMWAGSGEAPNFWNPNPYLTQAKHWGIPDVSGGFKQGSANRVYWGNESFSGGLSPNDTVNAMNQ